MVQIPMKTLIRSSVIAIALAFFMAAPSAFTKEKEHEEETINASDVPAAVQKAAEEQAKGGKIVRWEKEGGAYEAEVEMNGKKMGYKFDANGKMLSKHDESKEKGEKD
jgi:hypothetical protein